MPFQSRRQPDVLLVLWLLLLEQDWKNFHLRDIFKIIFSGLCHFYFGRITTVAKARKKSRKVGAKN